MSSNFYHPNRAHLQQICARKFSADQSRDFGLVRRLVSFPALLAFAGFPLLRNQQCFNHKGDTGTSLSFFRHKDDNRWMFCCNNPQCGIGGDVIDFWYRLVVHIRLPSKDWSLPRAAGDLLARVESGEIDASINEFEGASSRTRGHAGGDQYFSRLFALCKKSMNRQFTGGSEALPTLVRMSVKEAILGLFPEDGFLMVTPKREWHDIKRRDEWLRDYNKTKPPVRAKLYKFELSKPR